MLKPILALLLSAPFVVTGTEPAELSLEETFDALSRVITQNDEKAKVALRKSLQTADPSDYPDITSIIDGLYEVEGLTAEYGQPVATAMRARWNTIRCWVIAIDSGESYDRFTINYRCTLPDSSIFFESYREIRERFRTEEDKTNALGSIMGQFASALTKAPDRTYDAKAEFFRAGSNGPWVSGDMLLLTPKLWKQLLPFQEWNEQIKAEAVTAYSGIPACDLMLDAQLEFAERYDPDSPLQRGTTLQDAVEEKVRALGPELAAAYCRGTHERNRALWEGYRSEPPAGPATE